MANHQFKNAKLGVAALEFLFAAPAFFILVFFVVEIALVWNDRHIMRYAAYKAARAVVKYRSNEPSTATLCWSLPNAGGGVSAHDAEIQAAARRAALKPMSTITPTVTQLMTLLPAANGAVGSVYDSAIDALVNSQFGTPLEQISANPYVHALSRMAKGLPAAWVLTQLKCRNIVYGGTPQSKQTNGVEILLTYHRSAKMPYIGTLMWLLKLLNDWSPAGQNPYDGVGGFVTIDPLDYGAKINPLYTDQEREHFQARIKARFEEVAKELDEYVNNAKSERSANLPPGSFLDASTSDTQIFGKAVSQGFDTVVGQISNNAIQSLINSLGGALLDSVLTAPQELKTIPVSVSVRIPNFNQGYENSDTPWKSMTKVLGAFTDDSKIGLLSKQIPALMDGRHSPLEDGLPYVD